VRGVEAHRPRERERRFGRRLLEVRKGPGLTSQVNVRPLRRRVVWARSGSEPHPDLAATQMHKAKIDVLRALPPPKSVSRPRVFTPAVCAHPMPATQAASDVSSEEAASLSR
jgi:hypothetical protein